MSSQDPAGSFAISRTCAAPRSTWHVRPSGSRGWSGHDVCSLDCARSGGLANQAHVRHHRASTRVLQPIFVGRRRNERPRWCFDCIRKEIAMDMEINLRRRNQDGSA
jgi:hypothetical protein